MNFKVWLAALVCLGLVGCSKDDAGAPYRQAGADILTKADPDSTMFIIPASAGNLSLKKTAYITHAEEYNKAYVLFLTQNDEAGNYTGFVYSKDPDIKKGTSLKLLAPVGKNIKITIVTATKSLPPDVWEVSTQ